MAKYFTFDVNHTPIATHFYIPSPVHLDKLWLNIIYQDFLYKTKGLEEDLITMLRDKDSRYFIESMLFDELDYILDNLIIEGDQIFKNRVKEEFRQISDYIIKKTNQYNVYDNRGRFLFQSVDFVDPTTIGFFKIDRRDIEGLK